MASRKQSSKKPERKDPYGFLPVDDSGFHRLDPKPGGRYDRFRKLFTGIKLPKDSNKFLYDLVDTYGAKEVINMMDVDIGDYVYQKGINHALNVNIGRSIPWIEDGLKSGERRALYTMWKMKLYDGKMVKVAVVVGRMIETVYPHGDQAPADIIYRLGRDKAIMIPYMVAGGNFGNMEDQRPAAPRYASTGLTEYAMDCFFREIGPRAPLYDEKDNYDFSGKEPVYLISRYPNILMQWNQGIGKGASSWLGAFNSRDIFKAALTMLDDPTADINIYPDLPVPTPIVNKKDLKGCFDKAKFKVRIQSPYEVIVDKKYDDNHRVVDKYTIVFTAIPLTTTGALIKEQIQRLKEQDEKLSKKMFPEILDVNPIADPNSPGGIRLIIEYEKGYDPHALVEKLYRRTALSKTIGVQYELVTDNRSVSYTPRQILNAWISRRYDQKRRYYHQMALQAAKDRTRYEALCIILATKDATDRAIRIIRSAKDDDAAVAGLCKEFGFTEFQANQVLLIRLRSLSKMNVKDTEEKRDKAIADYKHYRKILTEEDAIKEDIRKDLEEGLKKYGKQRIAPLVTVEETTSDTDKQQKWIYYNEENYFCTEQENGISAFCRELDKTYQMVNVKNQDDVILVDRKGFIKILNGYSFSVTDHPISMESFGLDRIARILPYTPADPEKDHVCLVTREGYGKVMEYGECTKHAKGRLIVFPSGSADELADIIPVQFRKPEEGLICIMSGDSVLYTRLSNFPKLKRSSLGNYIAKGIKKANLGRISYAAADLDYLMIYGESGYIKFMCSDYMTYKRNISSISASGKEVYSAVGLKGSDAKNKFMMYDDKGQSALTISINKDGNSVTFSTSGGESQKFKIGSSIGKPIKVFKKAKNEYYTIV